MDAISLLTTDEERKAKRHAYYLRHRAERIAYGKKYYATRKRGNWVPRPKSTKEHRAELKRVYERNRHNRLKQNDEYRERRRQKNKRYRDTHKGKRRVYARQRRLRIRQTRNDLTDYQWQEILQVYGFRCVYCERKYAPDALTREHLTPVVKGGEHTVFNIVPACLSCNAKKGIKGVLKPVQPLLLTIS